MTENIYVESWKKLMDEQNRQMVAVFEQTGKLQAQGIERAHAAIEESARLMRSALDGQEKLAAQWRGLILDATRRVGESVIPKS